MEREVALLEGRRIGRGALAAPTACAFVFVALALMAAPVSAKHHPKGKSLVLKFQGGSQSDQALLSSGQVKVVVRSTKKRKLVLAVRGFGGGPPLTDPRSVKARPGGEPSR